MENVLKRGAEIRGGLEKLQQHFNFIREIRGEGLMLGADLAIEGAPIVEEALRQGLIINCTHEHILRFLPPFIIAAKHVREFLKKLESAMAKAPQKVWQEKSSAHAEDQSKVAEMTGTQVQAAAR